MAAERESFDSVEPASKTPSFYFTDMMEITSQNPIKTAEGRRVELSGNEIVREKHWLISQKSNKKYGYWFNICFGAALSVMGVLAAAGLGAFGAVFCVLLVPMGVVLITTAAKNLLSIHRIEKGSITAYEFDIGNKFRIPVQSIGGGNRFQTKTLDNVFRYFVEFGGNFAKTDSRERYETYVYGKKIRCGVLKCGQKEYFVLL